MVDYGESKDRRFKIVLCIALLIQGFFLMICLYKISSLSKEARLLKDEVSFIRRL